MLDPGLVSDRVLRGSGKMRQRATCIGTWKVPMLAPRAQPLEVRASFQQLGLGRGRCVSGDL